jgi:nitrate reductase alpha subunit
MDLEALAVRSGWMPFYPQFDRNPLDLVGEAQAAGQSSNEEILDWVGERIADGDVSLAVDDPDAEASWPRIWLIWRGNAIASSAKGQEFFLRHYLGTHDNVVAEEHAKDKVKTVTFREPAPRGKMDLVVDINFRMDTSALYSDIVLPTATWYEKDDLNTTDLHSYVHPLQAAVPPVWESKSDWEIFKALAKKLSELSPEVFPEGTARDVVMSPLQHDTPDELAQTQVLDWRAGECAPIPGKTMPHLRIVERDYANLYNRFISLGPGIRDGLSAHGITIPAAKYYDEMLENPVGGTPDTRHMRCVEWGGQRYPSVEDALDAANTVLLLAPETNGEIAYEAFQVEEKKTGLVLADLAEGNRSVRTTFGDLAAQPIRTLTSPCWTGDVNNGRAYAAWVLNVERLIPWRTLGGRQHLYVDHPYYIDFGEQLPTFKPKLDPELTGDIVKSPAGPDCLVLNYITPHGKWHIHSTFGDTHRMQTLSRGIEPCWINDKDAERIGLVDNDWVEVYNDNGVMVTRVAVSSRVQMGTCMIYHAPERTLTMPKSQVRGAKRGGSHNSLTRTRINPVQLAGGYAQFTYGFNYWGPIGVFTRDTYAVIKKLEKLEW